MKSSYRLVQPVSAKYTWKLLLPFNYAGVSLTLKPGAGEGPFLVLVRPKDQIWTIREPVASHREVLSKDLELQITSGIDFLARGIEKGAREVLATALDYPIEQVTLIVEKMVVDENNSTYKAFEFASKKAVQNMLEITKAEGLLVISEV